MTEAERIAALEVLFEAHETHQRDLRADDQRAIDIFAESVKDRLEKVNEFRQQLSDQAATFMPRAEVEVLLQRLVERLDAGDGARGAQQKALSDAQATFRDELVKVTQDWDKRQTERRRTLQGYLVSFAVVIFGSVGTLVVILATRG